MSANIPTIANPAFAYDGSTGDVTFLSGVTIQVQ